MIIIVDDTFIDRYKFQNVDYLKESRYTDVCNILSLIKTTELAALVNMIPKCKLFCNHKTLQLYNREGKALNVGENSKYRETLLNEVSKEKILRIEFSRGLETNFEVKKIDKDLFYSNLKSFLDYYIDNKKVEEKILFWC